MRKNTSKYNEDFIKNYDEDSNRGYILEVDLEYPKNLHDLYSLTMVCIVILTSRNED